MKSKYNLALLPLAKSAEVIQFAQTFSTMADEYLLNKTSLPHVTLYHFFAEENRIDSIWERAIELLETKSLCLTFRELSCITFDNTIYWISLLPDQRDTLSNLHSKIAAVLNQPLKKDFDPHMTLMNTRNKQCEQAVTRMKSSYVPVVDTFTLSLGRADDVGQFVEIIHSI